MHLVRECRDYASDCERLEMRTWRLLGHIDKATTPEHVDSTGRRLVALDDDAEALWKRGMHLLPLPGTFRGLHSIERTRRNLDGCLALHLRRHNEIMPERTAAMS